MMQSCNWQQQANSAGMKQGKSYAVWGKESGSLNYEEGELLNVMSRKYGYLNSFLYLGTSIKVFSSVFAYVS